MEIRDFPSITQMQMAAAREELVKTNEFSGKFGLRLSDKDIYDLIARRIDALRDTGRIELGQGILSRMIFEFCDSPYLLQDNYADTIAELQDMFYYFKNESMDLISDDELIEFMKWYFDNVCQGSLEYLSGTTLEDLCKEVRAGKDLKYNDLNWRDDTYEMR